MGVAAVISAFVAVAWPIRHRNSTSAPKIPLLTVVPSSGGHVLEIPDWSRESGVAPFHEATNVGEPTQGAPDPWTTAVDAPETPELHGCSIPIDGSARAYFEFRMQMQCGPDDAEERMVYRDYLDQCELGKYQPVSLIMFGKGLVKCGCEKVQVKVELPNGRLRRPNIIKWPMQLGMT